MCVTQFLFATAALFLVDHRLSKAGPKSEREVVARVLFAILTPVRSVRLIDPNTRIDVVLVDTPGFDLFEDGLQEVEKMILKWVKTW
jgi:hypothetical protein